MNHCLTWHQSQVHRQLSSGYKILKRTVADCSYIQCFVKYSQNNEELEAAGVFSGTFNITEYNLSSSNLISTGPRCQPTIQYYGWPRTCVLECLWSTMSSWQSTWSMSLASTLSCCTVHAAKDRTSLGETRTVLTWVSSGFSLLTWFCESNRCFFQVISVRKRI